MKWWKRVHRTVKDFWDTELRPTFEPVIRLVVKTKVEKELGRHLK